jgi:hypothetical protein
MPGKYTHDETLKLTIEGKAEAMNTLVQVANSGMTALARHGHEGLITPELIILLIFFIFTLGLLVGIRCQEINLRRRERRLAEERRRLNELVSLVKPR